MQLLQIKFAPDSGVDDGLAIGGDLQGDKYFVGHRVFLEGQSGRRRPCT